MPNPCENLQYFAGTEQARIAGDYAYARERAKIPLKRQNVERGYDIACHFAQVIASRHRDDRVGIERAFREQVARWKQETGHLSSLAKAIAHPSYLRIIGLASETSRIEIERLLLRELEAEPDHWFAALTAITGEDPVSPGHDFDQAVAAWIDWGKGKGII